MIALVIFLALQIPACYDVAPAEGDDGRIEAPVDLYSDPEFEGPAGELEAPYDDGALDEFQEEDLDAFPDAACSPGALRKVGHNTVVTDGILNSIGAGGPEVVWTGTEYAVVWSGNNSIRFTRISPEGERIGANIFEVQSMVAGRPRLAWTGSEFGLAWYDNPDDGTAGADIYFARLSPTGEKIGGDVEISNTYTLSYDPDLEWTGTEYGLIWCESDDTHSFASKIYFARISPEGVQIGEDVLAAGVSSAAQYPMLQWTGSEHGLLWADDVDEIDTIYFNRLSPTGERLRLDSLLTESATYVESPAMKWAGAETGFGVAWFDKLLLRMFFTVVSPEGYMTVRDAPVTDDPEALTHEPSLRWTGTEFGLAWSGWVGSDAGHSQTYLSLLSASGEKTAADLLVSDTADSTEMPALEWTGTEFGVAWYDAGADGWSMLFTRVAWCE